MENVSSEQELLQMLEEGKISQDEYDQLLIAIRKPLQTDSQGYANISRKYLIWIGSAAIIIIAAILLPIVISGKKQSVMIEQFRRDFPQKVTKLNIDTAKLDDIIEIFADLGSPLE